MLPNTETSVDFASSFLSRPPLITLGVKELKISFALAFSGSFTTSNARALWANLLQNLFPLKQKLIYECQIST